MRRFTGFEYGMGIGGWLTNYKRFNVLPQNRRLMLTIGDMEHFASYITEEDVAYIAKLGMDHIRLGFDQIVVEEVPGVYREEIFKHIDNFIAWCKKYGLNVVLNLHKAVGNYCDIQEEVELLDDEGLQERFIALWLAFENRYAQDNSIAFELLNEVREVDPVKWNQLAQKTINAIRHADIRWRENWMRDVIAFLKEQEIPYCVWNYLSTPNDGNRFSLVDDDNRQILSEKMARIIRGEEV